MCVCLPISITSSILTVGAPPSTDVAEEERDIWDDAEVLYFIRTHKYPDGLSAKARDRIYRRSKSYRRMGDGVIVECVMLDVTRVE